MPTGDRDMFEQVNKAYKQIIEGTVMSNIIASRPNKQRHLSHKTLFTFELV